MAATPSKDGWERFFKSCKLPSDASKKYAESFVKQRIQSHLLRDLGKEDLRELGIKVLGDQLAIITYVKKCQGNPPEFGSSTKAVAAGQVGPRRQVHLTGRVAPVVYTNSGDEDDEQMDDSMANDEEGEFLSKAPDRHDHYRVIMPEGKLARTRNILEMHETLKEQGLIKRGTSGIRRSGIEMRRVAAQSKAIQKKTATLTKAGGIVVQDRDITSSTGGLGQFGTLRSDLISTKTTIVKDANSPRKNRIANRISTSGVPIRVKIDNALFAHSRARQPPPQIRPQIQRGGRNLVTYGGDNKFDDLDSEEDEDEEFIEMAVEEEEEPSDRLPIAGRIQLIGGGGGENRAGTRPTISFLSGKQRAIRSRPRVTVGGRTISLGGGRQFKQRSRFGAGGGAFGGQRRGGMGGGTGGSILDRISLA